MKSLHAQSQSQQENIHLLLQQAEALYAVEPGRALELIHEIKVSLDEEEYFARDWFSEIGECYFIEAKIYQIQNRFLRALDVFLKAEYFFERIQHHELASALIESGKIYSTEKFLQKAKGKFEKALKIYRLQQNKPQECKLLRRLANTTLESDPEKAITQFNEAVKISQELGLQKDEFLSLVGIGKAHLLLDQPAIALQSARKAVQLVYASNAGIDLTSIVELAELLMHCSAINDLLQFLEWCGEEDRFLPDSRSSLKLQLVKAEALLKIDERENANALLNAVVDAASASNWVEIELAALELKRKYLVVNGNNRADLQLYEQTETLKLEVMHRHYERRCEIISINHEHEKHMLDEEIFRLKRVLLKRNQEELDQDSGMAISDPLTGLFNRDHFLTLAERQLFKKREDGQVLSIILIQIVEFNDLDARYGEFVGGQLLFEVSNQVTTSLRDTDLSGRYERDIICVLLSEADAQDAHLISERINSQIMDLQVEVGGKQLQSSINIGVASYDVDEDISMEVLLSRAEEALQQARISGKNQIKVYQ